MHLSGLDLFCGGGGMTAGFMAHGHHMTGVDIQNMHGVYPGTFVRMDALTYLEKNHGRYDFIIASPPCQRDCTLTAGTNKGHRYPTYTVETMAMLRDIGKPYIIENPLGNTPLRRDLMLCGETFGLRVIRHRLFEIGGFSVPQPEHIPHRGRTKGWRHGTLYDGYYYAVYGRGGGKGTIDEWRKAMGIDWMTDRSHLAEAIPPAYTEYIAQHMTT